MKKWVVVFLLVPAVCDGFSIKEVVIVGAGDSACEEAHYLSKLCKKVTMLVRKEKFRASKNNGSSCA
jgi:thioredoxin reductase (NADPH)